MQQLKSEQAQSVRQCVLSDQTSLTEHACCADAKEYCLYSFYITSSYAQPLFIRIVRMQHVSEAIQAQHIV
jgi:hypothetical protein